MAFERKSEAKKEDGGLGTRPWRDGTPAPSAPAPAKPPYDGPVLVTGMLEGKKALAWGSTFKDVEINTDAGKVIIPKGVTFMVLNSKKGKAPYGLYINPKKLDKKG